jgi:hypothetical protein
MNTLSILIPSIPERKDKLIRLHAELYKQAFEINNTFPILGHIEVLVDDSKSFLNGGLSIGKKRSALVKRAQGKYLNFLDDDDTIAPNYVKTLLELCSYNKHVCTFRSLFKLKDYWGIVNMSLSNKENEQATPDKMIQRPPWHICPIWTEFARKYEFSDINNAEDYQWMEKVLSHCQTEAHTDKIIFQYNHGDHSEADKIENLK